MRPECGAAGPVERGAEREVIRGCDATRFTELRALEPYYHAKPWSAALAGKRVLVVHPFRKTILAQYGRRAQLFPGKNVLPEFASLTVVQAVQGLGGQDTGYASWFDAPAAMEREMDAADYDVAIVGAGAYGLPLAAHARTPATPPSNERCHAAFVWHQGKTVGQPPHHWQAVQRCLGAPRRDGGHHP